MKQFKIKYKTPLGASHVIYNAIGFKAAASVAEEMEDDRTTVTSIEITKTPTGRPRSIDNFVLKEAAEIVVRDQYATVNYLCRKLGIGNARAGRIMDRLEELGIVGPFHGSKPRKVLQKSIHYATALASGKATNNK